MFEFWNGLKLRKLVSEYQFDFCQNELSRATVRCDLVFESSHLALNLAHKSTKLAIPFVFRLTHLVNLAVCIFEHVVQIFQVLLVNDHQIFEPNYKVLRLLCNLLLKVKIYTVIL